jgi:hypothetical protein
MCEIYHTNINVLLNFVDQMLHMCVNAETFLPFVSDLPWDHYLFELQKVCVEIYYKFLMNL